MRSLTIAALIFFGTLLAETMLEPGPLWATSSVRGAPKASTEKKKEIKRAKKSKQQRQAHQRDESLPPNLGPGAGLGL
jgi:hypothetical protein